jgi:hypothetical protein
MDPVDKKARTIKVVIDQLTSEYGKLAESIIKHMTSKNLAVVRLSGINDYLSLIWNRVPNSNLIFEYAKQGVDHTLYGMFRQVLVRSSYDADPVGHTGDKSRDEHLVFALTKIPQILSLETIAEGYGYRPTTTEEHYRKQEKLLRDVIESESKARVAEERKIEVINAIKARNQSNSFAVNTGHTLRPPVVSTVPSPEILTNNPSPNLIVPNGPTGSEEYALKKLPTTETAPVSSTAEPVVVSSTEKSEEILNISSEEYNTFTQVAVNTNSDSERKEPESKDVETMVGMVSRDNKAVSLPNNQKFFKGPKR